MPHTTRTRLPEAASRPLCAPDGSVPRPSTRASNAVQGQLETCYELLNEIDRTLKVQPIDVGYINNKVEELKNLANNFFEEIENRYREQQLAESAIVYANRDRNHQTDVHQQLSVLEKAFYNGEFVKVYHEANGIFQRMHVEEGTGANAAKI